MHSAEKFNKQLSKYATRFLDLNVVLYIKNKHTLTITMRVKCSYSEFFWSVSPYLFVFSLNAGKYRPKNSEYGHLLRSVSLPTVTYTFKLLHVTLSL